MRVDERHLSILHLAIVSPILVSSSASNNQSQVKILFNCWFDSITHNQMIYNNAIDTMLNSEIVESEKFIN